MTTNKNYKLIITSLWLTNIFSPFLAAGVNTILPAMGKDFNASAVELSLILLLFILAQVIFSILGGRFCDFLGHKRVVLASATLFLISTLFISLATNLSFLLFLRFIQGLSTAILSGCCTLIGISISPPEKRSQTIGILVSGVYLGLALGPLVFGYITSISSWRYAFGLLLIPITLLIFLLNYILKSSEFNQKIAIGETFDTVGTLLLMLGLGSFTFGIGSLHIYEGASWLVFFSFIVLSILIYHQWHIEFPTINVRILSTNNGFGFGLFIMLLNYGSIMGLVYFFSLYLQEVKGLSPFYAGGLLAIQTITQSLASPLGGKLSDKYSPEIMISIGMLFSSISIFYLASISVTTSLYYISFWFLLLGFGIGLSNPSSVSYTLANVHKKQLAVAIGLSNSTRNLGALLSYSLILIIVANHLGSNKIADDIPAFLQSMKFSLNLFTVSCVCGALIISYKALKKFKGVF